MIIYKSNAPVMLCLIYTKFTQMITNISFSIMHFYRGLTDSSQI